MAGQFHGISNGPNARPLDETLAETGPGVPDEARTDRELPLEELGEGAEGQAKALRRRGWSGTSKPGSGRGSGAGSGD